MKYIFIRRADGTEFPVFCVAPQSHADLAAAWRRDDSCTVVSAGFVEFHDEKAFVFGFSAKLQFGPRPGDARTLSVLYAATVSAGLATVSAATMPNRIAQEVTQIRTPHRANDAIALYVAGAVTGVPHP